MRFTTGVTASDISGVRTDVTVDNTVVAFLLGGQTLDQKTLTNAGSIGLANGSLFSVGTGATNTITSQIAANITTGNGLTIGQALAVDAGSGGFSTGSGTGFSCITPGTCPFGSSGAGSFNGLDSLKGVVGVKSTGAFTGTLFALTADQTLTGTVLGISANKLTSGKAIDVQLGALYSGAGAINVKAEAYTGTILNVTSNSAASTSTQRLANISSAQTGGTLLNVSTTGTYTGSGVVSVDANSASTGTVVNVSATGLTNATGKALNITTGTKGVGIFVSTAASGYTGNLIDLQANNASRFSVTETGATTVGGTLTVSGASITGPSAGVFTIDNGNPSAINMGSVNVPTNIVGNFSVGSTRFTVAAATGITAIAGTLTVQNTTQIGDTTANHTRLSIQGGTGLSVSPTLNAIGDAGSNAGILLVPTGTGRISVTANGLDVTGDVTATTKITTGGTAVATNGIELAGSAGASPVTIKAVTNGNSIVNVQVVPIGATGALLGPTSAAFNIDSNGNAINIGTATAAMLTLGRLTTTQALAGSVTVGSTLAVTGAATFSSTLAVTGAATLSSTLAVTGATTLSSTLAVTGATTLSSTLTVTGATTLNGGLTVTGGSANFGTNSSAPVHIETRQTTPPVATVGLGAGSGGTCTLGANSTDAKGFVTIVVAGAKTASAAMCTITFNAAFGNAPAGVITPGNALAAGLANSTGNPFVTTTTAALVITANTITVANATYVYYYYAVD